jgi:spore coat polysaccharide biosynthesis protein SpsF (cytidylyltransferase family)
LKNAIDYSSLRLTLDEKEDLILIEKIVRKFKNNLYFSLNNILHNKYYLIILNL